MADRVTVYPTQVPYDTDILKGQKNMYVGLAKLTAGVLGKNTLINGFAASATPVPSLAVLIGEGEIYSLQVVDNTPYGSLPADTTHTIVKQGIAMDSITLSTPAPVTVGYSINYLIQVAFNEADTDVVARPYFNSDDPSDPTFTSLSDTRQDQCVVTVKSGIPASTGTQTTPSPDTGNVGARVVTVAYGQTTVTSGNISTYASAPFITETLTQKISQTVANTLYKEHVIATTASVTSPLIATKLYYKGCGAGGGGGGSAGVPAIGSGTKATGGGAGGASGVQIIQGSANINPGEVITITINAGGTGGAGGAAGNNPGSDGSPGGSTVITGSFGVITLPGGNGGGGSPTATGSDVSIGGRANGSGASDGTGSFFQPSSTDNTFSGNGGAGSATIFGPGGGAKGGVPYNNAGLAGYNSPSYGAGGGGAAGAATSGAALAGAKGGDGFQGAVVISFA